MHFLLHAEHSSGLLRGLYLALSSFLAEGTSSFGIPVRASRVASDTWIIGRSTMRGTNRTTPPTAAATPRLWCSVYTTWATPATVPLIREARGNATDHFKLGWNEAGTCLNPLHRQLPGCNTLEFNLLRHGFRVPIMQNSEVSIMYLHVEILPIVYGAYIGEGRRGEGKGGEGQRREERGGEGRGGEGRGGNVGVLGGSVQVVAAPETCPTPCGASTDSRCCPQRCPPPTPLH